MKAGKIIRIFALVLSSLLCSLSVSFAENKFVPPEGKVLLMAGQSRESIEDYVATTGIVPGGVMLYTSVQMAEGLTEASDLGSGEMNGHYLLEKYPHAAVQVGLSMVDGLDAVLRGTYDGNIDDIADWIKAAKRPVYLRIGYEFDGPHNHYNPRDYVKAYRHIVKRFRKKNVDNVAFVWHSYASRVSRPLTDWYPGHEFVDWFGISYFAQHESLMKPMLELARGYEKPVMIAEATPAGIGTAAGLPSWKKWFGNYFSFIKKYNIKCACYINDDWDSLPMFAGFNWKSARLSASDDIKNSWLKEITQPQYLQSSDTLFELLKQ